MRLIDAMREAAERDYMPVWMFAMFLVKLEAMGYDLNGEVPRATRDRDANPYLGA